MVDSSRVRQLLVGNPFEGNMRTFNAVHVAQGKDGGWQMQINWLATGDLKDPLERVDLSREPHGLSLLSWFTPLDKIKGYRKCNAPWQIFRIDLEEHALTFEIKQE